MAQKVKETEVSTTLFNENTKTSQEMRDWYTKNKRHIENYAKAEQAARSLKDVTKTATKTVTAFSKDSLRTYLQNIGANSRNLRNLSRYLFYRCHAYYRWVMYNSNDIYSK